MTFCGYNRRIAILLMLALITAEATAASPRHRCPDMIEGKDARMRRDLHLDLPSQDRSGYVGGCSGRGRKIQFRFRLEYTE